MIAARLSGDRLHLQHGPIDLIIGAEGDREAVFAAATERFDGLLERLVEELPLLRRASGDVVCGPVAQRMARAVAPHQHARFVTPMAAVAGAVADHVLHAIEMTGARRAYVNNGGDIALYLTEGRWFEMAMAGLQGADLGRITIEATDPIRGIATSGAGGRSLSMGIADSVTVLSSTAAEADVAATLIANAVDVPGSPAVRRIPARELDPDSDLGDRLVVTSVGALGRDDVDAALRHGSRLASDMAKRGLIRAAALFLRGQSVTVGQGIRSLMDA